MPRRKGEKVDRYGSRIERIDRRREVWTLRASGYSYRQIAEIVGISRQQAHDDLQKAEDEWGEIATDPEVLREGLLGLHSLLNGRLLQALERQLQEGQLTQELDSEGNVLRSQRKNWPTPQIAAELSRNMQRMAVLMGLTNSSVEGGAQSNTTIVLQAPSDGASFENKWAQPDRIIDIQSHQPPEETPSACLSPADAPEIQTSTTPPERAPEGR